MTSSGPILSPARRIGSMKYAVRDILGVAEEAKAAGREMLYLNIGDPNLFDYETPGVVVEAICRALRDGRNGYAPSDGVPGALDAIRADAEGKGIRGIQDVFVSSGCSEGIEVALSALCNPGENILTPSPGYPLYTALVAKIGLEPNAYFLKEEDEWQPDLDHLESQVNERTRAIVLINPNNPTGSVCSRETLEGVLKIARRHHLLVISDEIYGELTLDGLRHIPTASLDARHPIMTFDGLSKAYLGPGLRVGWGILSGDVDRLGLYRGAMAQLLRARLSANHPEQYAIAPCLNDKSHLPGLREKVTRRRDITVRMLNDVDGITCVAPRGAFYAFPRLDVDPIVEEAFIADLIRATGVVVVHGGGFGQPPGTAHFRVVFLPQEDVLERAYGQIKTFIESRRSS